MHCQLLPAHTKTELGEALSNRIRSKESLESDLWCIARIGARELFYGPVNQVLSVSAVSGWVKTLLPLPQAREALSSIARRTGDPTRDFPSPLFIQVRQKVEEGPDAEHLLAILEGSQARDVHDLSRIFGEQLPSGLRVAVGPASESTGPAR